MAHQDELEEDGCYVALTTEHLIVQSVMDRVRSPAAGAIVLFAGSRIPFPPTLFDTFPGNKRLVLLFLLRLCPSDISLQAQQETTLLESP
jgi:hypothetical protein